MPRARDHFADFLHSLAARFFFPLGFKFCCMVLRVANARALIIDLRRHYYLQLGLWLYPMNYTQKPHRDPGLPSHYLQFSVHIHYR